jgi:hypothetical protein
VARRDSAERRAPCVTRGWAAGLRRPCAYARKPPLLLGRAQAPLAAGLRAPRPGLANPTARNRHPPRPAAPSRPAQTLCSRCELGYVAKSSGFACYCAPGYYTADPTNVTGSVGFTCQPCGPGAFCPGSRVTAATSATRIPCGANKLTTTSYAQSDLECMVMPGYGWGPGDTSAACDVGTYNPGYNARKCTVRRRKGGGRGPTCREAGAPGPLGRRAGRGLFPRRWDRSNTHIHIHTLAHTHTHTHKQTTTRAHIALARSSPPQPCSGGLTTLGQAAKSSQDCLAGVGLYYLRGKALACARGTYKNLTGNQDCAKCPTGTSTPSNTVAADAATKCSVLLPGYSLAANPVLGVTEAAECPTDTYRAGEAPFNESSPQTNCTPCPNSLVTLPGTTRATTLDACVTPPGYGWSAATNSSAVPNSPAGQATTCPVGQFNPGYSRQPCASCGSGLLTDAAGALNADACYTPAGWGNLKDPATGVYNATICPIGTYGRANK